VALPAQRELRQCDYAWVEPSSGRVVLEGHRVVQAVAAVELDEGAGRSRSVQPDLGGPPSTRSSVGAQDSL
jgi:hypothetical protein